MCEWIDAAASMGWVEDHELASSDTHKVQYCVSVGIRVYEDKDQLILAGTYGHNTSTGMNESNNRIAIPKGWIKQRKVLYDVRPNRAGTPSP